jgi:hypothetical protein
LGEASRNEARFVFVDAAVGLVFDSENPLAADDIAACV